MEKRRRVDWSVILGPERRPSAVVRPAPEDNFGAVITAFEQLLNLEDVDSVLKSAVELARSRLGLKRVAFFLYDEHRELMLGTWGTDLEGRTVDEHHVMYQLGVGDREAFRRAEQGERFTVFDDCPIVVQKDDVTEVVGAGWVACTPIRGARGNLGVMFNDAGTSGAPLDAEAQERASLLCSFLGVLLDHGPRTRSTSSLLTTTAHPIVVGTLRLLAKDPSMVGKELAAELGLSVSRLARVFKEQMGMSLVEYRNRLRLERFDLLLDQGGDNLLGAALAAGFGSYSQFHRVFRAMRGVTPKRYIRTLSLPPPQSETRNTVSEFPPMATAQAG